MNLAEIPIPVLQALRCRKAAGKWVRWACAHGILPSQVNWWLRPKGRGVASIAAVRRAAEAVGYEGPIVPVIGDRAQRCARKRYRRARI